MLPVNGFFGHIQKNHARSLIMFMGFMIAMHIVVATLLSIPFPFWNHFPVLYDKPLAYIEAMIIPVSVLNLTIFTIFYFGHTFLLKWTIGFEPIEQYANPRLHSITQELADLAGIAMPSLEYIATPALNSFACGLSKNNAHIVVTQGILDALDDEELAAVIAHEIAHIKNGDMHMMAVANAAIGSVQMVNFINPMKLTFVKYIPKIILVLFFPFFAVLGILLIFYSFIMQLASLIASATRLVISSSREYIADAEAVRLTHNPAALVSALSKIHGRSDLNRANDLTNAMMIDGPTTGKNASHPPMQDRIKNLVELSGSMIHGVGMRKDTRERSLAANHGNAYGGRAYSDGSSGIPTFAGGFGRAPQRPVANIREYIPNSPDYAEYQDGVFTTEPQSVFDRIALEDDGEFGIDRTARWVIIAVLATFMVYKQFGIGEKIRGKEPEFVSNYVQPVIERSPVFLAFDLDGDGLETTRHSQSRAYFDFNNQGKRYRTGWLGSDDGLLFYDVNNNGRVDGVNELVRMKLGSVKNNAGLHSLMKFDGNQDKTIDKRDVFFRQLKIWRDLNSDGVCSANEVFTLDALGIQALGRKVTGFDEPNGRVIASGAMLIRQGRYLRDPKAQVKKHLRDPKGGNMFLTAFEVDFTRYQLANGVLITKELPSPEQLAASEKNGVMGVTRHLPPTMQSVAVNDEASNLPNLRGASSGK